MRAEFFRTDAPSQIVAAATWVGQGVRIETENQTLRDALERIFRPSPVSLVDAAVQPGRPSRETVLEPGDLEWFRAAATARGESEGLAVRFVTEATGGWDPAGMYRSMRSWVADRETTRPT